MRDRAVNLFAFDLTGQQRQLCTWVAEQASSGVNRVYYDDVRAALGAVSDVEITRVLREIRERLDDVHEMVQFPLVNTTRPFFEIHRNADYIWDDYRRAEREEACEDFESHSNEIAIIRHADRGCAACVL